MVAVVPRVISQFVLPRRVHEGQRELDAKYVPIFTFFPIHVAIIYCRDSFPPLDPFIYSLYLSLDSFRFYGWSYHFSIKNVSDK